ncbi:sigma-70 family RNA polymerase sigma factor [uncultured Duncaniella sp.]|uniref:sigma-70 family RNA polymerase sigma factor n=2 Tax=uncultured Duncaniella sp. TaxID=2768039 RepID=UPI002615322A|nr:sigma-70 family RNA polymerase sigma factor [uncultured Duncaniella sp.]
MDTVKLIGQCAVGDRDAMARLYHAYSGRMLKLIERYVNEPSAAEDILHDGFLVIFSHISELRAPEKLEYWMGTIMKNLAIQYLSRIEVATVLEDMDEPADTPDMNDILSYNELEVIINKLPEGYRKIFKLAVLENKSHKEIGKLLGIAPHSSSSQLARAKAMMRKLISERQAALALMVLLLLLSPISIVMFKTDMNDMSMNITQTVGRLVEETSVKSGDNISVSPENLIAGSFSSKKTTATRLKTSSDVPPTTKTEDPVEERIEANEERTDIKHEEEPTVQTTEADTARTHKLTVEPVTGNEYRTYIAASGRRHNGSQNWSVGLTYSLNTDRLANASGGNDYTVNGPWNDGSISGSDKPTIPPEPDYSNPGNIKREAHHSLPVTFGISLSRSLSPRTSIETGLNLTYMRSNVSFGFDNHSCMDALVKSYYLGIPVKLNFKIATYEQISIYGSGGMAVDIPLSSTTRTLYKASSFSAPAMNPRTQFSLSVGLGLDYRLTRSVSIYAEPSLRYYPANGSSLPTIRSEHPFEFTIPIGLRFNL